MSADRLAGCRQRWQRSSALTPASPRRAGTRRPAAAAARGRRPAPAPDGRTSARRTPSTARLVRSARRTRRPFSRSSSAPNATSRPKTSSTASSGWRAKVEVTIEELAHEHAEGRQSGDRRDAERPGPSRAPDGVTVSPRMSAMRCVPLTCATWPTEKKIADLVRLCMVMCSRPAKLAERAAHAEGEGDDAHVLDRGIGEHAFDVAPAIQHERGEDQRQQAQRDHQRARARSRRGWPRSAS